MRWSTIAQPNTLHGTIQESRHLGAKKIDVNIEVRHLGAKKIDVNISNCFS